jgi:hypothetical protein
MQPDLLRPHRRLRIFRRHSSHKSSNVLPRHSSRTVSPTSQGWGAVSLASSRMRSCTCADGGRSNPGLAGADEIRLFDIVKSTRWAEVQKRERYTYD